MISNTINEILNEQINKEFYSGYLYLSMSAHLKELGLNGFASWTRLQAKEEVEHGLKIFDYIITNDNFVTLKQIRTPEFEFQGISSIFNRILEHEQCITRAVMNIAQKDFTAEKLQEILEKFINNPTELEIMARNTKKFAIIDADKRLADVVETIIKRG